MEILSVLVLLLFTLLGYSIGATISAGVKRVGPQVLDLVVILLLWVAAFLTRDELGKWLAILVWLGAGLVVGLVITRFQKLKAYPDDPFRPPEGVTSGWRLAWQRWLHFSSKFGDYQSRALLAFLYFSIVLPFGLGMRLFGNPLNTRKAPPDSVWHSWNPSAKTVDEARRQF